MEGLIVSVSVIIMLQSCNNTHLCQYLVYPKTHVLLIVLTMVSGHVLHINITQLMYAGVMTYIWHSIGWGCGWWCLLVHSLL